MSHMFEERQIECAACKQESEQTTWVRIEDISMRLPGYGRAMGGDLIACPKCGTVRLFPGDLEMAQRLILGE